MKNANRILSVILAALMISCVPSCSDKPDDESDNSNNTPSENLTDTTPPEAETDKDAENEAELDNGRSNVKDSLPDNLDFGNMSVRVLSRTGDDDTRMEFCAEEMTGDIVNDAVYERNLKVQERLNIKMEVAKVSETRHGGIAAQIRESVSADSDDYDLIANAMYNTVQLIPERLFLDLGTMEYLDFSAPWYNQAFLKTTNLNGKNYTVMGELSQTMISGAFCMFFNKDLLAEHYSDINLYETVNSGKWTIEKMTEICEGMYSDTNGNGIADEGDTFGHFFTDTKTLGADSFFGASKIDLLYPSEDGSFEYNGTGERMVEFSERMHKLLFEDNNTIRLPYNNEKIMETMLNRQTVFTTWMLTGINYLREMEDNFGIIPMPKLNETQESYTAYTHDGSSTFSIPTTNKNTAATAAFLEAMSAETYRTVTPAYFETAIKSKYSRDSETSQMLDTIISGIYLDYSYIFGQSIGTPIDTVRGMLGDSSACEKSISTFTTLKKSTVKMMDRLVKKYQEMK